MKKTTCASTLWCMIIFCWTTLVCSKNQCSANFEGNDVVSIEPYYVREMGGEQLIIDLPCQVNEIIYTNVKCKFESFPDTIFDGEILGENQVACVTPAHIYLGIHQVYVSVDDGYSFEYTGSFYAVSEEILKPHLKIENFNSAILQDFTTHREISLLWDKDIFSIDFLSLKLMMIIDPFSAVFIWNDSTVLIEKVENTGKLSFKLSSVFPNEIIGFETVPLTYGVLKLFAHNTNIYIAGPITTVTFFSVIPYSTCDIFVPILEQKPKGTIPCPCTIAQVEVEKNFKEEKPEHFYHPGVETCFRSVASEYGSSEQCCYNSDGSVNIGTDGSGSPDTYSPDVSTIKHYVFDVLPWFVCCKMFGRCRYYYSYRPSDDCSNYKPAL